MSKNPAPKKERKTRMTGTDALRPCVQCRELKPRFTAFKPRWAGCEQHRTERGRRFYQKGCAACDAKVKGNIRQPRCIDCDKSRSKKRKPAAPKPTKIEAPVVEPTPEPVIVEPLVVEPEPIAAVIVEAPVVEPEPTPEPVAIVGQPESSPESVEVTPEPSKPARPQIASMADLSKLFGGE